MLPSKRKREDGSSNSSSSSSSSSSGSGRFAFLRLPNELQANIIELACRMPTIRQDKSYVSLAWYREIIDKKRPPRSLIDLDMETTLALTSVCRAFYPLVARVLFSHIRLTRPSALKMLQRTLSSRPWLGSLIKSLHLGPDERRHLGRCCPIEDYIGLGQKLPLQPLSVRTALISASCCTFEDDLRWPEWCEDGQWPLKTAHPPPDCRSISVLNALGAVQQALDVDLDNQPFSMSNQNLGYSTWYLRMFQVQAALDLYLDAMQRCEKASSDYKGSWRTSAPGRQAHPDTPIACREGTCGHYPPLTLVGYPPRSHAAQQGPVGTQPPLVISRAQITDHLARPGAETDRFDHIWLFLRSGTDYRDFDATSGRAGNDGRDDDDRPYVYIPVRLEAELEPLDTAALPNNVDLPLPDTGAILDLIDVARSVIRLTPNVVNLSLTGFLVQTVCGSEAPPALPRLTSLSLGPLPPHWCTALRLDHSSLPQVKNLRLAGMALLQEEVSTIAHRFKRLEKMQWVMGCAFKSSHPISLVDILSGLCGSTALFDEGSSSIQASSRSPEPEPGPDKSQVDITCRPMPLIEVQLHANDVAAVLGQVSSGKVREALRNGDPLPGPSRRRLLLEKTSAAEGFRAGPNTRGLGIDSGWDQLYKEGWQWWIDHAELSM